ncbi:DUF2207 domain-containing protein [Bhargavaea ginsengi]|uniref:DUF2207 domain-containing protein n=1 Tax=Bhargavaea ginsengi TaxID=426757 RepID=UPI00203CC07F|nr:DUF2207 domain-containing protein [Bhargavaea ginsengi]MCM3087023.1 DUF2207 domain-containing protein [Bhargavaea ginsengi]
MTRLIRTILTVTLLLFLFPAAAMAVDFEITDSTIEAKMDKSGRVNVTEYHTYQFDGDFNGVTRMLVPKEGTDISGFNAFENGKPLRIEKDGDLYKAYRGGEDETVTIEFRYVIEDAVTLYEDGAEFYWPFFDDRNESDYENMIITIAPPESASGTELVGYDEAAGTGTAETDGTARFELGQVDSGENGDIRVVFAASLFPSMETVPGTIRDTISAEQSRIAKEQEAAEARRRNAVRVGNILLPAAGILLLTLAWIGWKSSRRKREAARLKAEENDFRTPDEIISMPAAVQFTSPAASAEPERLSAALLDLIRKGQVVQVTETRFEETDQAPEHKHEEIFRSILFDSFGDGTGAFDLDELKRRTEDDMKAGEYSNRMVEWIGTVAMEIKEARLREAHPGTSGLLVLTGSVLAGTAIYFGISGALVHLAIAIPLAAGCLITAAFLRPLSDKGHLIREQWRAFTEKLDGVDLEDWQAMPREDRLRGYIYAIGTKNKHIDLPFARFAETRQASPEAPVFFGYDPLIMNRSFAVASTHAAHSSSSSSSTSSGGGTGGGGGGSGAF